MPRDWKESLVLTSLMVSTMATTMLLMLAFVLSFTDAQLWFAFTHVLPIMVPFGIALRTFVLRSPIKWVEDRLIRPRFDGLACSALTLGLNILVMNTIMRASGMMLGMALQGRFGEMDALFGDFMLFHPTVCTIAFLWSFMFVSPLMRFVFGRIVDRSERAHAGRSKRSKRMC